MYQDAMRKREGFSYSPIRWWQNSSETWRLVSAPTVASLQTAVSSSLSSVQGYTTITLTTTEFTTVGYSAPSSTLPTEYPGSSSVSPSLSETPSATYALPNTSTTISTPSTTKSISYSTTTIHTTRFFTSTLTLIQTLALPSSTISSPMSTANPIPSTRSPISSAAATSIAQTSTQSTSANASASTPSAGATNSTSGFISRGPSHAAVVAGGITGGVAGLSLIFFLFLFLLRRHRRKPSTADSPPPIHVASPLPPSYRDSSAPTQPAAPRILPTIEHNLIRIDTNHWDRPQVSTPPRQHSPLRLMNPDAPSTPRYSGQSTNQIPIITTSASQSSPTPPHNFLQRQKSALAAAFASMKRGISSSSLQTTSSFPPTTEKPSHPESSHLTMPSEIFFSSAGTGVVGDTYGAERGEARQPSPTPSPSSTQTIIRHHAPEDPFYVQPSEPNLLAPPPLFHRPQRFVVPQNHQRAQQQQVSRPVSPLSHQDTGTETETETEMETGSNITRFESGSPSLISEGWRSEDGGDGGSGSSSSSGGGSGTGIAESRRTSVRSGPFDLATPGFVGRDVGEVGDWRGGAGTVSSRDGGRDRVVDRSVREETPNWVGVYEGT